MSHSTLPVLTHQDFPQVFEDAVSFEVRRVSRVVDNGFGRCAFEDEHCDCRQPAVVHLLGSDSDFCLRHFSEVSRG